MQKGHTRFRGGLSASRGHVPLRVDGVTMSDQGFYAMARFQLGEVDEAVAALTGRPHQNPSFGVRSGDLHR